MAVTLLHIDFQVRSLSSVTSVCEVRDTMVKLSSSAELVAEDTRLVEAPEVGINGNSDWLLNKGGLETGAITLLDLNDTTDLWWGELRRISFASLVDSGVWVRSLLLESTNLLDVLESTGHPSTVASLVAFLGGAVHQLLLRERVERSVTSNESS